MLLRIRGLHFRWNRITNDSYILSLIRTNNIITEVASKYFAIQLLVIARIAPAILIYTKNVSLQKMTNVLWNGWKYVFVKIIHIFFRCIFDVGYLCLCWRFFWTHQKMSHTNTYLCDCMQWIDTCLLYVMSVCDTVPTYIILSIFMNAQYISLQSWWFDRWVFLTTYTVHTLYVLTYTYSINILTECINWSGSVVSTSFIQESASYKRWNLCCELVTWDRFSYFSEPIC